MQCTPITIRTPVSVSVDITELETTIMNMLSPAIVDIIASYGEFEEKQPGLLDDGYGFELTGKVVQNGTLIHIPGCGLEPDENNIEPEDIPFTEKELQDNLRKFIITRMSGEEWKRRIATAIKLSLTADTSDRDITPND